jgi:hypothetical protein
MDQKEITNLSILANVQDVATKVIMAAAGDDFALKPESDVREDVATKINNKLRGA